MRPKTQVGLFLAIKTRRTAIFMNVKHITHSISRYVFLTFFCLMAFAPLAQAQRDSEVYKKGETIFKAQCTSCHQVHKQVVGPALAGVYDKRSKDWLYSWVQNSQAMVKAGDPDAVALFNQFNKSVMTAFALKNEEIDAIMEYIKVETENPVAAAPTADAGAVEAKKGFFESPTNIFLSILTLVLLILALIMARVNSTLGKLLREKMGQLVPDAPSLGQMLFSRKTIALGVLGLVILGGYTTVENAQRLGRQQGYKPAQPIKFSHKIHAGTNKIDCQYCHSGASKGKSAVIPSPSTCMNCHKAIKQGAETGTTEIAKIYAAIGWDPDKQQYKENYKQQPIEWVRVHNLPDHVYFNHSQHVTAGGLECQQCHGKVEEMDVLEQHSSLGMGWCVNCHRQTEVRFQANEYYKSYEQLHEDLKSGKINKVTVEDIGGTECQKCHY